MYRHWQITALVLALALAVSACTAGQGERAEGESKDPVPTVARTPELVGTWRGTSTCVDLEHFPACKDEEVIYEARQTHSSPDTVAIRADKLVDGARAFMGELHFTPQGDSTWVSEVQTPQAHFTVTLRRVGDRLTGVMTDIASGRRTREIALELAR